MSFAPRFHRARVGLPVRRLPEKRHEDDVNGGLPRPPWGWAGAGLPRFERVGLGRDNAERPWTRELLHLFEQGEGELLFDKAKSGFVVPPLGWGESRKVRAGFRGLFHKCARVTSPRAAIFTFNSREIALNVAGSGTCLATISKMSETSAPANSCTSARSQRSPRSFAI